MARDISSGFSTEIDKTAMVMAEAIKVELDSGDIRVWSGYGDLVFNGETYLGAGQLLSTSAVDETQALEATNMQVVFSGILSSYVSIVLSEDYQNRPLTRYLLMIDGSNIYDLQIFSGLLDQMELMDTGETATITATIESDMAIVTDANNANYTPENQKALFAGDLGLDGMPISADVEITWGQT